MKNAKEHQIPHTARAVIYARVSTLTEEQQTSFESQQQAENYANVLKKYGAEIARDLGEHGVYSDEGISGTVVKKRAGFLQMIEDAEAGKIDLILTKSISRFSRNLQVTIETLGRLRERGVRVYFQEENLDSLKTQDQFLMNILSAVYEQEAATVKARVKQGFQNLHAQGKPARRSICYGYRIDPSTKEIIIDETEAEVIRTVFNWFVEENISYEQIAQRLYKRGVVTRRGTRNWTEEKLRNLLMQKKYIGITIEHDSEGNELKFTGQFPPIVSEVVFEQAQEKFRKRAEVVKGEVVSGFRLAGRYALSDKVKCKCGRRCTRKTRETDDKSFRYPMSEETHTPGQIAFWECQRAEATYAAPCTDRSAAALSESYINLSVMMSLREALMNGKNFLIFLEALWKTQDTLQGDFTEALRVHEERLEALQKRKNEAKKFFISGIMTADEVEAIVKEIQLEIEKEEKRKPTPPETRQIAHNELLELTKQLTNPGDPGAHKMSSGTLFHIFTENPEFREKIIRSDLIKEIILSAEDGRKIVEVVLINGNRYKWSFKRRSPYRKHGKLWGFPEVNDEGELTGEIPGLLYKQEFQKPRPKV